jgi:hypothetical protein
MTRAVTLLGFGIAVVCALGLETVARRSGRLATFGAALSGVMRHWPFRVLVRFGWLWLGWHLFVRVDWR